jgi:PAS domain-containing protein
MSTVEELRAILQTYRDVKTASWPELHQGMAQRAPHWASASEAQLKAELQGYLAEASARSSPVRVFWKLGPDFHFGGCSEHFARDAGLPSPEAIVGLDDFSPKLPWGAQAAKYRADDKEVYDTAQAKLDILERQTSGTGAVQWVRVGKAPIKGADGKVIGLLGMYELLDEKTAQRLYFERLKNKA